jgi:hypothetical protein
MHECSGELATLRSRANSVEVPGYLELPGQKLERLTLPEAIRDDRV